MTKNISSYWIWHLRLIFSLSIGVVLNPIGACFFYTCLCNPAVAQISPDRSLGTESSVVIPNVEVEGILRNEIEGGAIRGGNLFHSFEEFSVSEGQGAYFVNPDGIRHIFSRVTGNGESQILGQLGVLGSADLFLINPNGIFFGPNSSLDLNGSFLATTASSLIFQDGYKFDSQDVSVNTLLTVSIPASLQFRDSPGDIINQSQVFSISANEITLGLGVKTNNTLGLIGGKISFQEGGSILGDRIRIELGSVAGTGLVRLQSIDSGWALSYEGVQNFQDIELSQSPTLISTTGLELEGGGSIQAQGKNIFVQNGSQFFGAGSNIVLSASETINVSGTGEGFSSAIASLAPLLGQEGSITINTKKLIVQEGGNITVSSNGELAGENFDELTITDVSAGDLVINASESVELIQGETITGTVRDINTGLFSLTESFGDAGNITINTKNLTIRDGAIISVESSGLDLLGQPIETGAAGNIIINASSLTMNQGSINAETFQTGGNEGANIIFNISDVFKIENESSISAQAFGSANGGNIDIETNSLIAFPPQAQQGSDIIANASEGQGGNININAQGIFGIEQRNAVEGNQTNDIDASSEFGLDGVVEITQPDLDPNRGLIELPQTVVDPNTLIAQNPCKRGLESEFVISGRGGLPPSISEDISSDTTQVGLVEPVLMPLEESSKQTKEEISSSTPAPNPIIPAQGWVFNEQGQVVLVAYDPADISAQRLKTRPTDCSASH